MERRNAIKSLGTLSLGMATPSLANAEELVAPYETQKKRIVTDIMVVGGGTAGTIAAIQAVEKFFIVREDISVVMV